MPESKERLIDYQEIKSQPEIKIVDVEQRVNEQPLPREVATWMEIVEGVNQQNQQKVIRDTSNGQPLMTPVGSENPKVTLPISRRTFSQGFTKTVSDAGRWLSEYLLRMIKIKKGNVKFNEE